MQRWQTSCSILAPDTLRASLDQGTRHRTMAAQPHLDDPLPGEQGVAGTRDATITRVIGITAAGPGLNRLFASRDSYAPNGLPSIRACSSFNAISQCFRTGSALMAAGTAACFPSSLTRADPTGSQHPATCPRTAFWIDLASTLVALTCDAVHARTGIADGALREVISLTGTTGSLLRSFAS